MNSVLQSRSSPTTMGMPSFRPSSIGMLKCISVCRLKDITLTSSVEIMLKCGMSCKMNGPRLMKSLMWICVGPSSPQLCFVFGTVTPTSRECLVWELKCIGKTSSKRYFTGSSSRNPVKHRSTKRFGKLYLSWVNPHLINYKLGSRECSSLVTNPRRASGLETFANGSGPRPANPPFYQSK